MFIKPIHILMSVPNFIGRTFSACTRMQRRVNRRHNSLTVDVVKRQGGNG